MIGKLKVNGKEVDTSAQVIAVDKQVIDINNPTSRTFDITNRFALPKTPRNKEIFESPDLMNSDGDGMDKLYTAKYSNQSLIFEGVGFINSYTDKAYNFQLASRLKDLFDNLKEEIKVLGFDDQDIVFNKTNYDLIKLDSDSNLWVWPIVSMHETRTVTKTPIPVTADADLKYIRPFFRFKYLLAELISAQNWGYEIDSDLMDSVCISSNHAYFYVTSYQKEISQVFTLTGSAQNVTDLDNPEFNKGNTLTSSTSINIGGTRAAFRFRGTVTAEAETVLQVKGVETVTLEETVQTFTIPAGESEIDFTSKEFGSDSNTVDIEITVDGTGDFEFNDTLLYTIIEENNFGDLSTNPLIDYKVKAYDNLLQVSQTDLVKLAAVCTNSVFVPDSFSRTLNIKTLNKLSKLNAVDWSDKYDEKSELVENRFDNLAQLNELTYDNDETVSGSLGKDSFQCNNKSLEDKTEFINIPYGATNDIELAGFTVGDFNAYDDTERINTLNPRILYFYNNDDATPVYTLARFEELKWVNLNSSYYSNWFASLFRVRYVEGLFDLKKNDVFDFDHLKLVYVKHFKSYFFVPLIKNYVPGVKTVVEMLKFL